MKLRNLLLTAALFLTAGIASAAVVYNDVYNVEPEEATEDNPRAKIGERVSYEVPDSMYYLKESRNPDEEGFLGDTYGKIDVYLSYTNPDLKYSLLSNFNREIMSFELKEGPNKIILPTNLDGMSGAMNNFVFVVDSSASGYLNYLGENSMNPALFAHDGRNSIVYNDGSNSATVTFGSPLPTPVVTLLIALGFGAAFVMYRNRKQVKA